MSNETQKHPQFIVWEEQIEPTMKTLADICAKANIPFAASFAVLTGEKQGKMASYLGVIGGGNDPALINIMDKMIEISDKEGGHQFLASLEPLFEMVLEKGVPAGVSFEKVGIGGEDILEQILSGITANPLCNCAKCVAKREAASQVKH